MPTAISSHALAAAVQEQLQIIDVRRRAAFVASDRMIAQAVWRAPEQVAGWLAALDSARGVVVYCVHGHEVSQRCAEALEIAGFRASYLEGGFEQWNDEGRPTIVRPSPGADAAVSG